MISPAYAQAMAAYNARMNRSLYNVASLMTDAERRADRGAFWRSIHGTFNHLLWADRIWMHRFDGWERPATLLRDSGGLISDFAELHAARAEADAAILDWSRRLDPSWLDGQEAWFSGAVEQDVVRPRTVLVMHLFNHQAHHRGQVHGMLTAGGQAAGETDLWFSAS